MTDTESTPVDALVVTELRVENLLRVKAVTIRPEPGEALVVIGGNNGQGKSSILNAIAMALGGGNEAKALGITQPIRHGEEHASVSVDLGRFRVTRHWDWEDGRGKSKLVVTSPDGAVFRSAQSMLDEFLGQLTFDPLAFMRQTPKAQLSTLLPLVDLPFDLDEKERERQRIYDERTLTGRIRDLAVARAANATEPEPGSPDEEVSTEEILAEHSAARALAEERHTKAAQSEAALNYAAVADKRIESIDAQIAKLQADRATYVAEREAELANAERLSAESDAIVVPDMADIEERLAAAESTNVKVRAAAEYKAAAAEAQQRKEEYEGFTFLLAEIDGEKTRAIRAATMPIDGLTFDDKQVFFNDVPLAQCSSAEQLRVSMAIGMALNPRIRVMCITDGSLLDDASMLAVEELAAERGYQVWVERVGVGDELAFVIEDGEVVHWPGGDDDEDDGLQGG